MLQQLLPADPGKMSINCHAFEHIVGNFVSNAVKFSPFESTVSITLTRAEKTLRVTVEGEGLGIPPQETRELFSGRRYHGSARPMADEEGSSLGLYLTYRLAERIGAELDYELSPNFRSVYSRSSMNPVPRISATRWRVCLALPGFAPLIGLAAPAS